MSAYVIDNYQVFYNVARGCIFFWCLLAIIALVWIILMFVKKKIGQNTKDDVYKTDVKVNKDQISENELKNMPDRKIEKDMEEEIKYEASEKNDNEQKKSDIVASAPKSQKPQSAQAPEPQQDSKTGLQKAMYGFQQFLFLYAPFICINILNVVCIRTWVFNLVIWFLILIPIIVINLLGLFIKIENRFVQCLLKSIWIVIGVLWYINFFTIKTPYRAST